MISDSAKVSCVGRRKRRTDHATRETESCRAGGGGPEPGRYVLDEQVGFLMRVAMQRHTAIFMSQMIEGLTQTQFAALAKLYEVGPCSQNHLGRLIYLDAATIKGVVDRLERARLRHRARRSDDRRRRAVALTERGRSVTEAARRVAARITADTLVPLTPEEQRVVAAAAEAAGLRAPGLHRAGNAQQDSFLPAGEAGTGG